MSDFITTAIAVLITGWTWFWLGIVALVVIGARYVTRRDETEWETPEQRARRDAAFDAMIRDEEARWEAWGIVPRPREAVEDAPLYEQTAAEHPWVRNELAVGRLRSELDDTDAVRRWIG